MGTIRCIVNQRPGANQDCQENPDDEEQARRASCKRNYRDCAVDAHVKGDGSLQTPGPLSCPPKHPPRGGRHERSVAVSNVSHAEPYAADPQAGPPREPRIEPRQTPSPVMSATRGMPKVQPPVRRQSRRLWPRAALVPMAHAVLPSSTGRVDAPFTLPQRHSATRTSPPTASRRRVGIYPRTRTHEVR